MKAAYVLAFAVGAMALTVPVENKRDAVPAVMEARQGLDLLGALTSLSNTLTGVQSTLTNQLNSVITNVGKGVTNVGGILASFVAAITNVSTATSLITTAITTISNLINPNTVTQAVIDDLAAAVGTLTGILKTVQTVETQLGGVGGILGNVVSSEISALNAVLAPFVAPVENAVASVITSLANDKAVDLTNLKGNLADLENLAKTLLNIPIPTK